MEVAGIEPASRGRSMIASTCVVCLFVTAGPVLFVCIDSDKQDSLQTIEQRI